MSKVRCYKCGKLGHYKRNCKGTSTPQEQSNLMLEDDEPSLLMTTHETEHEEDLVECKVKLTAENMLCRLSIDNQAWLWHARLGHLNFDDINKMTRKGLVEGIPRINHAGQICDACLLGKHSRTPFPNQAKFRSKNLLDLVYGDLCGPISPATHSGKKFIFLLVDDCTRFMWAYFLTTKDQAFSTFKEFRQHIEMETRMKLRMLRTYRGAYAKITIPHLKKLDDRSIPMIYLGVEEGSKACRLYDPKGKRKHVSRDVRFMEIKPWDWDNNREETSTQDSFWASFVVEGADNENTTQVNSESNDNTYEEQQPITAPDSPITPPTYTYNPYSEEAEEATSSSTKRSENGFDDT
ncbi:zinc finger, CCHC-type containing protein [Tanacetum coccineum]